MKLLILSYEYPPIGSGAGMVCQALASAWTQQGMACCVVTSALGADQSTGIESGVEVVRLATGRKSAHQASIRDMLRWAYRCWTWINGRLKASSGKPPWDLVLANFVLPGGMVAHAMHRKHELPYVLLTHGHDVPGAAPEEMEYYHAVLGPYMRRILGHAAYTVVLNTQLKKLLDRSMPYQKDRHVVLPNGMDAPNPRSRPATKEALRLVWAGRLVPQKRPDVFLDALLQLPVEFQAELYGDGPLKQRLEARIQALSAKQQARIHLKGRVPHAQVLDAMNKAHALVMSSRFEAMSLVALEAIACGTWVITPAVGGIEHWLEPGLNGECVEPATAQTLASSMLRLNVRMQEHGLHYSAAYRQSLTERLSWAQIADQYRVLFSNSLEGPPMQP